MCPSDKTPTLVVACACMESSCATWLELTPDGILAIEDVDGQRLSIDLPDWLDDAMRTAIAAYVPETELSNRMAAAGLTTWPVPTVEEPDLDTLGEWLHDSICEATDGCPCEPDGICEHEHPSWFLQLGLI